MTIKILGCDGSKYAFGGVNEVSYTADRDELRVMRTIGGTDEVLFSEKFGDVESFEVTGD